MVDTDLMPHRSPGHRDPATPSIEVAPNLLSPGDHIWAGRDGEQEWKRVDRVEFRPGARTQNGLGQTTGKRRDHHVIFCADGWEAVVMRGDEVEVRIGSAGHHDTDPAEG